MSEQLLHFVYPVLILILAIFFVYRLRVGQIRGTGSAVYIYVGLIMAILYTLANLLEQHPDFNDWFLEGIYPIIVIAKFAVLVIGLVSFVIGIALHFSYWDDKLIEINSHKGKLKLLESLQLDCRTPYPINELLERVLNSLLQNLNERYGAVYLYSTSEKQFSLTAVTGLSDEERALMETYPFGKNIITEAVEIGEQLVTSDFRSFGGKAQLALAKFNSLLVVPLVSGKSRLGVLLFFSTEENHFTEDFLALIWPIAGWLAEKVEVSRLGFELRRSVSGLSGRQKEIEDVYWKLNKLLDILGRIETPSDFARQCLGIIKADEAWLIGLVESRFHVLGGSESRPDFSDNFKSAVLNAMSKEKVVVLNQEKTEDTGRTLIAESSIILPIKDKDTALLVRNRKGSFEYSESDLLILKMFAALGRFVIAFDKADTIDDSRKRGNKAILNILNLRIEIDRLDEALKNLMNEASHCCSSEALYLLFRLDDNKYSIVESNSDDDAVGDLLVKIGEGTIGKTAALRVPHYTGGSGNINRSIDQYGEENKNLFRKIFGDRAAPVFQGDYPVSIRNRVEYILTIFDFKEFIQDEMEKHQLLSILSALFNIRYEIAVLEHRALPVLDSTPVSPTGSQKNIMVVADQPVILDLLNSMCRSLGYQVHKAHNGREGLEIFENNEIDILIIDISSDITESDLVISDLARQRFSLDHMVTQAKKSSPRISVIGVVGWGISLESDKIAELGIDEILYKPFRLEQLSEVIAKLEKSDN